MTRRIGLAIVAAVLLAGGGVCLLAQRGAFPEGPQRDLPVDDPKVRSEWGFARLNYSTAMMTDAVGSPFAGGFGGRGRGFGFRRWAADYPRSDVQFIRGVVRLTRVQGRPTSHVVDLDSDDIYNWPWVYAEDPGAWNLTREQAARLRDYLLRGGFLMTDDSTGEAEWQRVVAGLQLVFPERATEDLRDTDELFHVVYDLDQRVQIHGTRFLARGYPSDARETVWRGIRDDKGRILVAICHNMDIGDAWEWADSPDYPEAQTSLAYRIGVNYIIYSMTH